MSSQPSRRPGFRGLLVGQLRGRKRTRTRPAVEALEVRTLLSDGLLADLARNAWVIRGEARPIGMAPHRVEAAPKGRVPGGSERPLRLTIVGDDPLRQAAKPGKR